jgi:hypothetical protein
MDIGQLEQKVEKGLDPIANIRLKMLGPRANGASTAKGYFYIALAGVTLAIISQYTSMQWAKYAKDNYKPNYIFMDPSGSAFLVETPQKDKAIISEDVIRSWIWRIATAHYEAVGDTAARQANSLINYYFDGDALRNFRNNSDNLNILGTSAEKAQLINSGFYRYIELRSMRLLDITNLDNGSQKISAELMFYARTYARGSTEPTLRRAFRVWYELTIMSPLKPGLDLIGQRRFLLENPILLRVQSFNLQDENPGTQIPVLPENQSPQSSHQSRALTATGATPVVAAAKTGGPVAVSKTSSAN